MKKIGIIGGMSWKSSTDYYKILNELVSNELGGHNSADLILRSINFSEIEEHQRAGDWDRARAMLADAAFSLEAAGADFIILATNTMHKVSDGIINAVEIPFLRITDAVGDAILDAKVHKVGLLGTRFTMEETFYSSRLEKLFELDVETPDEQGREEIHRVIFEELTQGKILETSRARYIEVIQQLKDKGCQGVILGCTEIQMLIPESELEGLKVFDSTKIHCQAAVDFALAEPDLMGT
jgi:aspartate racemase